MTVPTESKTYQLGRWSLNDLYPGYDSPEMEAGFAALKANVSAFETRRDELTKDISSEVFLEFISEIEGLARSAYGIYGFASLWFNEDTQNQNAQNFVAKVQQLFADFQNRTLFFSLWWKAIEDEEADRLLSASGEYRYWLEKMRKLKPHTLSEPEEKIINIKDVTGASALETLFDTITNRYVFHLEVDGEVRELTFDSLMTQAYSADPDLRKRAYQELYRVYQQDAPILGQIYQNLVRDWRNENVDLRKFSSPIAVRNLNNDIPDEVVDTLIEVARANTGLFQRYFQLKAKWLGMDRLRRFDIYAPVVESSKEYEYNEAIEIVMDSFRGFEPKIEHLARKLFDENHIDSSLRKGKSGGAFCYGVLPDITPWVLVNYDGRVRDVATIAHELGHAVHSMLAGHHPVQTFSSTLPLAETASTFGEMLVIDSLLADEQDAEVRTDLLFRQMDDAYATIMRQIFFAMFEREAHDQIHQGASIEDLAALYWQNLQDQFGDSLDIGEEFRWEWVLIPHFYGTPFYVYAYAFGQLLVLSLYQEYKKDGEAFTPKYLEILAAGGSKAPVEVLAAAGVDVASPGFWQGGFDVLADWLAQLEAIPVTR